MPVHSYGLSMPYRGCKESHKTVIIISCYHALYHPTQWVSHHIILTITGESIGVESEASLATTCKASLSVTALLITVVSITY